MDLNPDVIAELAEHLTLLDQATGALSRFEINAEQRVVLEAICAHARVIILKARQQGISTIGCLYDLVHAIVHPGHIVVIVADVQEKAEGLLAKCTAWAKQLHIPIVVDNVRTLTLANGSSIEAKSAVSRADGGESRLGRSKSYALIHLSEMAFMGGDVALFSALTSTLLPGGKVIVESTASPSDNLYNRMWHDGPGWHHLFFSVEAHVPYQADPAGITDELWAELQRLYGFRSRPHAAWWWNKLRVDLGGDEFRAQREYPVLPDQAFVYAEGRWIHAYTPAEGIVVEHGDPGRLSESKVVEVRYEHGDEPCVFGVDTALGTGGDFSALAVIGRATGKIHRTWYSNALDITAFSEVVIARAKELKPEAILVEDNGVGVGSVVLLRLAGLPVVVHHSEPAEKPARFAELRNAIQNGAMPVGPEVVVEIKSSVVVNKPGKTVKYMGRDDLLNAISFARTYVRESPYVAPVPQLDPTQFVVASAFRQKRATF